MFLFQFLQNISIPKIYHFFTFLQDRPWFLVLPFFLLFLLRRANFAKREAGLKRDAACENFCWSVGLNLRTSCLARSTDGAPWSFRAKWKQGREREWLNEWEWSKYTYRQTWFNPFIPKQDFRQRWSLSRSFVFPYFASPWAKTLTASSRLGEMVWQHHHQHLPQRPQQRTTTRKTTTTTTKTKTTPKNGTSSSANNEPHK